MEQTDNDEGLVLNSFVGVIEAHSAVNPTILDYYKKFGRKRDLEQYFSLSTAQRELRDPSSLFWTKMKAENESSDSSEKCETSTELCRISVKCSVMDQSSSQESEKQHDKSESVSPPIITEEAPAVEGDESRHSDDSNKSDDNHSHKSNDGTLDTSAFKPQSPASSVTSQRKLEWDSLADVGYANDNERIASSSSLSTLERLALKQQYSDNQPQIGMPTAQSTPVEEQQTRRNIRKQPMSKTTEIFKKDVDVFEINVPHSSHQMPSQSINVNLTKHISFNVENSGVKIDATKREVNVLPNVNVTEPIVSYPETAKDFKFDKEIQTSLKRTQERDNESKQVPQNVGIPVIISLNTLKRRMKNRKTKRARRKPKPKKHLSEEKTGDQVSDAESFEYMPGHIYNQNKLKDKHQKPKNIAENKSSLESSGGLTTGSSKTSNISFAKDLDKCIDSIKVIMQEKHNDSIVKKKLVKEVVQKLLKSKYKDDESTTDFLSGLSFNSKRLGLPRDYTTTSTSDTNRSSENKNAPKKSILRSDRFNPNMLASTSQSAPNIPSVTKSENAGKRIVKSNNSSSELSSKCKDSSDNSIHPKTSSEELYLKYLDALKKEQAYKTHLIDKEKFMRQKLVGSDSALRQPIQSYMQNSKLRDLIKDLTRNNYDDGSGDASKLEGGGSNSYGEESRNIHKLKTHSRFTLSDKFEREKKNKDKKMEMPDNKPHIKDIFKNTHYCCCPLHSFKIAGSDSGCQVNIQHPSARTSSPVEKRRTNMKGCNRKQHSEDCGCYKTCSERKTCEYKYSNPCANSSSSHTSNSVAIQSDCEDIKSGSSKALRKGNSVSKFSQSSQTNVALNLNPSKNNCSTASNTQKIILDRAYASSPIKIRSVVGVKEVTRWIQTDISIDPKISDPSLSDINIVNEIDFGDNTEMNCPESLASSAHSVKSINSREICDLPNVDSNEIWVGKQASEVQCIIEEPSERDIKTPSKYSIPLQGTNVKLMVSITPQITESQITQTVSSIVSKGIATDNVSLSNKSMCSENKCSKEVEANTVKSGDSKNAADCDCSSKGNEKTPTGDKKTNKDNLKTKYGAWASNNACENCFVKENQNQKYGAWGTNQYYEDVKKGAGERIFFSKYSASDPKDTYVNTEGDHQTYRETHVNYGARMDTKDKIFFSCPTKPHDDPNINESLKPSSDGVVIDCANPLAPEKIWALNHEKNPSCPSNKCKQESTNSSKKSKNEQPKQCFVNVFYDDGKTQRYATFPNVPKKKVVYSHTDPNCECTANFPTGPSQSGYYYENLPNHGEDIAKSSVATEKLQRQHAFENYPSDRSDKCSEYSKNDLRDKYEMTYENVRADQVDSNIIKEKDEFFLRRPKDSSSEDKQRSSDENQISMDENDPIMSIIKDITKRYTKKESAKSSKKKCFKEILTLLNHLLDTEESTDREEKVSTTEKSFKTSKSVQCNSHDSFGLERTPERSPRKVTCCDKAIGNSEVSDSDFKEKVKNNATAILADKSVQSTNLRGYILSTESSDLPTSSDLQVTSDSTTCHILHRIKKECEKYHQKKCRSGIRKCDMSSSTSVNCESCKKIHYCGCRLHKCKSYKIKYCCDKKKRPVAYNLIIQPSDSVIEEETPGDFRRQLKNIVVKVPSKKFQGVTEQKQFNKIHSKHDKDCNKRRSKSQSPTPDCYRQFTNDSTTTNGGNNNGPQGAFCVREYLERNRPDFIENTSKRQDCMKVINECRASKDAALRRLLSMHLEGEPGLRDIDEGYLRLLSRELGRQMRKTKVAPKIISEREMKLHSKNIYKSLPEVQQKKEEIKKERIKKTNLLMASIFKRNLQRKTLCGTVNLSNYSSVIKL